MGAQDEIRRLDLDKIKRLITSELVNRPELL